MTHAGIFLSISFQRLWVLWSLEFITALLHDLEKCSEAILERQEKEKQRLEVKKLHLAVVPKKEQSGINSSS